MPRPRIRAGQIGAIRITELPNARVQANARMRDETGALRRLKTIGDTEEEATRALHEQADIIRFGSLGNRLTAHSTVAEACAVFLEDKRRSGNVEASTIEAYESSIAHVVAPGCGELLLSDMTVLRSNRVLQRIRERKSLSAARKARSVLSQVCLTGIEHGVLAFNPVRDARPLPLPPKKESVLTPPQLEVIRTLIRGWRIGGKYGPRPNVGVLENVMSIMVGTSARIGEVLALRQLGGDPVHDVVDVQHAGDVEGPRAPFTPSDTRHLEGELDVACYRLRRVEAVVLEHHRHLSLRRRHSGDVALPDDDAPGRRCLQSRDDS